MGYYQACERLDETVLAPVGEKVAGKIRTRFEDAIAFVVRPRLSWISLSGSQFQKQIDGRKLDGGEAALVVCLSILISEKMVCKQETL